MAEVYGKAVLPNPIFISIEGVVQSKCPLVEEVFLNQIFVSN